MTSARTRVLQRRACLQRLVGLAGSGLAAAAIPATATATAPGEPARARLLALADRHFDALLDDDPFLASSLGLASAAQASAIPWDIVPAHRQRRASRLRRSLTELQGIPREGLAEADQITHDVLRLQLQDALAWQAFPDHLFPVDQLGESTLAQLANAEASGLHDFSHAGAHAHYLARLRQLPAWCHQAQANLREGLRRGVVLPRLIVQRTLPWLQGLVPANPALSPYSQPLQRWPQGMPATQQAALRGQVLQVIRHELAPAVRALLAVLRLEVLPRARRSVGLAALPGGQAWYAHAVQSMTTTDLSPAEIHAQGLREVASLLQRLRALQASLGHQGSLSAFHAWHDALPAVHPFRTEAEVLQAYEALNQRIAQRLPGFFGRAPRARLAVRAEPALTRDTVSDHYQAPAADGSRPGIFYAVVHRPEDYLRTGMATLLLHEGQPGHHFQWALAQELPLPRLQRHGNFTAYSEGWALYAETLGYPLGLYDDPDAHLGHLRDAMLRAVRLVVDTGLHALGWPAERASRYLAEHTGYPPATVRAEIERYIMAPGQALAYAVGRATIERLRDQAQAALGERFSLAAFHDQVLASGGLPLAVLQAKIQAWLGRQQAPGG